LIVGAVILFILLLSLRGLARFYTDYLWFQDVGFTRTWRALLSAKAVPALIFSAVFFVLMLANLIVADRLAPAYRAAGPEDEIVERYRSYVAPYAGRVRVGVALFFAIVMGSGVSAQWQNWILFSNSTDFGVKDPQFHRDIGFYVFRLPFERFAAGWTFAALLVVLIVSAVFHYLNGGIRLQSPFQRVTPQVKVHVSVLLAFMALTKTVQYYLAQFALTLSHSGFVHGASYTDVHARLPAYRLLIVISVAAAGLFIWNIWRRGWIFPIIAVGLWGFITVVVGTIYPAAIQRIKVQPNELSREQPYIKRNISATRAAFNLGEAKITTQAFTPGDKLDPQDVKAESATLDNVRVYDPARALEVFRIKDRPATFHRFNDVDVDRYAVGAERVKPALVSVRELDLGNLPESSWTNQHLVYTHGYGLVAAAADQVNGDVPSYLLNGIPPTGDLTLDPKYAGVYFGENLGGYAVVDTKVAEQEADQATPTTKYTAQAGVPVSSFLRKAALALRFGDWNLLVSGQVTSKSRVIYNRDVLQRVQSAAPFLKFDADPYPVLVDGRIVWMLDAYTTTNSYPYSQSIHPADVQSGSGLDTDFNYVRNSVKATVDAYDGTIHFYVVDPTDPMVRTYRRAFPGLFEDVDKMPQDLRAHWRYPEDLFRAQTEQYTQYHVTDPAEFFRKQAIWQIASDPSVASTSVSPATTAAGGNNDRNSTLSSSGSPIEPLYLALQLPGQTSQEFVLERSFTPRRAANLTAFVVARSDGDNYGKLVVYDVPDTSIQSPSQAASAIESDQFISGQFTLLGQGGSKLLRGEVQLIPIGNALLYVRPYWVEGQATQTYPRFRFVAAVAGDRAVIGYDINDAVTALVTGRETQLQRDVLSGKLITDVNTGGGGGGGATTTTTTTPGGPPVTQPPSNASVDQLLQDAQRESDLANAALARQDFAGFGAHYKQSLALVADARAKLRSSASTTTSTPVARP
jgi:hypothetical protein